MAKKSREELEAFAKKMHDEGAAGFAAGLTPWETWDDFEHRVGSQVSPDTAEPVTTQARPTRTFGDRIVVAMTTLAVATLAVGIAGVYIARNPPLQLADNSTQLSPVAPGSAASGETSVVRSDVSNPATPVNQGTATTTRIDMAAAPSATPSTNPGSDALQPVVPVAADKRLATLDETAAATAGAMPDTPASEQTVHMDSDTPLHLTPADGDDIIAMLEELPATAAGARPMAPASEQTARMDSDAPTPVKPIDGNDMAAAPGTQAAATVTETPGVLVETGVSLTLAARYDLSAPAAGKADVVAPDLDLGVNPQSRSAETGDSVAGIRQNAQTSKRGAWLINLASYTKQSTAEKMRDRFIVKGVAADQVVATVNGKTYYRLQVTGFASRKAALTESAAIKEKLGLADTWITKQ